MNRVTHFEIHAENMERAIKFYTDIFGWEFKKWEGPMEYWMIMTSGKDQKNTGPGIDGGLVKRQGSIDGTAVIAYVCTVEVDNVDTYLEKIQKNGGTVALPKMPIPSAGWLAYCKDTEGNLFGIMQNDTSAK